MDFKEYIDSLDEDALADYAARVGTSVPYLARHLAPRRKTPRREMMISLAKHSGGKLNYLDVLSFFYFNSDVQVRLMEDRLKDDDPKSFNWVVLGAKLGVYRRLGEQNDQFVVRIKKRYNTIKKKFLEIKKVES